MKTILKWTACAACAVWTGASASAATETVTGQNVIGLTTIKDDSRAYLPLAAAYTGTGATELTVANIVQTATLAEGDELYAYDPERKQYDVYTLGTAGKWTAVKTVEVSAPGKATETTSPAAANRVITCGRGFWIVRKADASRAKPVRLVGDVPATAATVAIPAAVDGKPSATLIGVPSDWTLNGNGTDWTDKAAKGDKIRVLNEDGKAWREIVYDGTKWIEGIQKVGENGTVTFEKNENPSLQGGYAVWYMRAGKTSFSLELPELPR
ncbi:MAG: hypothetical protein Q4G55_07425 [bacterium]|nr:hypothetical protein [bacterium]